MNKFTVKDFITYNNPCFSCESKINFSIGALDDEHTSIDEAVYFRPTVTKNYSEIDLIINYTTSLKLFIFHTTNKILSNDFIALTKYLERRKLFLSSFCHKCHSQSKSKILDFNLEKKIVKPTTLLLEETIIYDDKFRYLLTSNSEKNKSYFIIEDLAKVKYTPTVIESPLIFRSKFNNRQSFIDKTKLYVLFS